MRAIIAILLLPFCAHAVEVDAKLPDYEKPKVELKGELISVGTDTLNNLMTLWIEEFQKLQPTVKITIVGKGSMTAPPSLIAGYSQFGPMSRLMKENEIDAFKKKYGYEPACIRVSLDALAIFVHKDNPLKGLALAQADAIFSSTRNRGATADISTWGQLGLKEDWEKQSIKMVGRNSASGSYGFFKERLMAKGDFKKSVEELAGSASVIQAISKDLNTVGYAGIGYLTEGVRAVPLAEKDADDFVEPTYENALKGSYPLSRYFYIYFNKAPDKLLKPEIKAFLNFVLSKQGQEICIKDGYFPLTAEIASEERKKLE